MYPRLVILVFLAISSAFAAPQDITEINGTFVQPLQALDTTQAITVSNNTAIESITDNLPTTPESSASDIISLRNDVTTQSDQSEVTTDIPTTVKTKPLKPSFIKPKPKFVSKLSYFNKASVFDETMNLVERTGKRKFKSRCRCEKIWNCPKLQITVPRCPDEYFLCCF